MNQDNLMYQDDSVNHNKPVYSYSKLRSFCGCKRYYRYRYIDKIVHVTDDRNLILGSAIHTALEKWHSKDGFEKEEILSMLDDWAFKEDEDRHKAKAMANGYFEVYKEDPFNVLEVEYSFDVDLGDFGITGRVDGLIQNSEGEKLILEHKTAAYVTPTYLEKLEYDHQILIYATMVELFTESRINSILYNVLAKPLIKQKNGETEKDFLDRLYCKCSDFNMFTRKIVHVDDNKRELVYNYLQDVHKDIIDTGKRGSFYRNNLNCFSWGRKCEYYDLCYGEKLYELPSNLEKLPVF